MLNPVSHPTIRCLECDKLMFIQTKAHLKLKHNMTKEEYLKKHKEQAHTQYWGTPYNEPSARRKHEQVGGVKCTRGQRKQNAQA